VNNAGNAAPCPPWNRAWGVVRNVRLPRVVDDGHELIAYGAARGSLVYSR
jgi:hypothetical protein